MRPSGVVRFTSYCIAATVTIFLIGLLTIVHEYSGQFRQILVSLTGHHWTTMSILTGLIFIGLIFIFSVASRSERIAEWMKADKPFLWSVLLVIVTFLMTGLNLVVYILHYF
ncbi:MAG: hypothetical protein LUQ61_05665 [Methanoregulaceae archaeon]|jgi:magnesium-transporting ATPase (P-type)|nr:hypothetical protein [Methanoregulaceae archaeon]